MIFRLGYLQIVQGDEYQEEIENAQYVEINQSVPRGEIYDRNGNLLVGNESRPAIYFTRHRNMNNSEIMDVAEQLSEYIHMDVDMISLRDKQDFVINHYHDEVASLMSDEYTLLQDGNISRADFNEEFYNRADEGFVDELLSEEDLNILGIYVEMVNAPELNPAIIKNEGVTEEEFASVNAALDDLEGISTGMDWERYYPYDSTLKVIFGEVSSPDEGVPRELLEEYLAQGYSRNDRVGKTYLERQYEDVLRGEKEQVKYSTDKSGRIIDQETVESGEPGDDLYLTIDIELQLELEGLAEHHLMSLRELAEDVNARDAVTGEIDYTIIPEHLDTVLLVVQDPNNGDVLAMVGKQIDQDGDIVDFHYGTLTSTFVPGSSIKGATIVTGYQEDVLDPGEVLLDEPLRFSGDNPRTSFFNRDSKIPIDDQEALMVSSNVYMYKVALRLAGIEYEEGMSLPHDITGAGQKLRNGFSQFGLGVSTGIDLPNEALGLSPDFGQYPANNYLSLSIGQYDTYSALQLSQYVSTIATGGKRMEHSLAKEVRGSNMNEDGPVLKTFNPTVLNNVNISEEEWQQVHDGFYDVFNTHDQSTDRYGTGWDAYHELEPKAAGKTGTAETYKDGDGVFNQTYLGYAPYDDPDMAFSVIFPNMPYTIPFFPAQYFGADVVNKFYELKYGHEAEAPFDYDVGWFYPQLEYGDY